MAEPALIDVVVLLLTNGMTVPSAVRYCVDHEGMRSAEAKQLVAKARARITVAADYVRDEELGKAVLRLEGLYGKSLVKGDVRTALQTQRELNRLLGLYGPLAENGAEGVEEAKQQETARQLELVAGYLLPLELTDGSYPVEEHARLAAAFIQKSRG